MTVSVPIRGLFNLTAYISSEVQEKEKAGFRPHQGII